MLSKTFKFVLAVTVATSLYFGFTAIQDAKANEPLYNPNGEQLVEADEPIFVGNLPYVHGNGVDFAFDYDEINKILSDNTAKYLWIDETTKEGEKHDVYSVSEEYFITNLKQAHAEHPHPHLEPVQTPIIGKVNNLRELAEITIKNLTSLNGDTSTGTISSCYISAYQGSPWECLNGGTIDTDFPADTFKRDQLRLDISNPVASTIICGNKKLAGFPTYAILVNADVSTLTNEGKYKTLSWVPEKEESHNVNFLITFTYAKFKGFGDCLDICDVAVLNHKLI